MQKSIIGWDIGGAHVKAALLDYQGCVIKVSLQPCPLWKGLQYLQQAVGTVLNEFSASDCSHTITMTGELVDLFDSREQGVKAIIQAMKVKINSDKLFIYAGKQGLLKPNDLSSQDCLDIASVNWLASASYAAAHVETGLFIDIGSTTTDILLLADGAVKAQGFTDYQRLVSAELVYTGIVRTAVMAIAQEAEFKGQKMGLMAEYFATMADVYRLTDDLNEAHDLSETADGAAKTPEASARRLSRMTGYEFSDQDWPLWQEFAEQLKTLQKQKIAKACKIQLARMDASESPCFIGAGIGRFLVRDLAVDMGCQYLDFNELTQQSERLSDIDSADCAPAVAVAALALEV
jgi:probable H4MPT-linked C1 transfer pathway protein